MVERWVDVMVEEWIERRLEGCVNETTDCSEAAELHLEAELLKLETERVAFMLQRILQGERI